MRNRRSAILISPPVYDSQYWAHWSLPYGLLRVASWLRNKGYTLKLIDCMDSNSKRTVSKQFRKVRRVCSTFEYVPDSWSGFRPREDERVEYCFGLTPEELGKRLQGIKAKALDAQRSLFEVNVFPEPDEIWISSIMTYWWESTRDVIQVCKEVFPEAVDSCWRHLPDPCARARDGESRPSRPASPSGPRIESFRPEAAPTRSRRVCHDT